MPDRKYTYSVEIDANQARQTARQMRAIFQQELSQIDINAGGVSGRAMFSGGALAGASNALLMSGLGALGGVAGAVSVRRLWEFGEASTAMARKQADAAKALAEVTGGAAQAADAIDRLQQATDGSVDRQQAAILLMKELRSDTALTTAEAVKLAAAAQSNATAFDRFNASLHDTQAAAFGARSGLGSLFEAMADAGRWALEKGPLTSFVPDADYWARMEARTSIGAGYTPLDRRQSPWGPGSGFGEGEAGTPHMSRLARQLGRPLDTSMEPGTFGYAQFWGQLAAEQTRENQRLAAQGADKAAREWERAANETERVWAQAAQAFEGKLRRVPGLFGTSDVTADQMKLAALGVPQNFADNYLRRLEDEVRNKKDYPGVSLAEASGLAGIDQSLPREAQLMLFRQKWADQSLFANKDAIRLIDRGAFNEEMLRQQAQEQGTANILAEFGLNENMAPAARDKLLGGGVNLANEIYKGYSNQVGEKDWVAPITAALINQAMGLGGGSAAPAPLDAGVSGALGIIP